MANLTIQDIIDSALNDIDLFTGRVKIMDDNGTLLYESTDGIEGGVVDNLLAHELLTIHSEIIHSDDVYTSDEPCIVFEIEAE